MSEAADPGLVRKALVEIRALKARVAELEGGARQPVAIVGMGMRYPGEANDAVSLWRLLRERRSGVVTVPAERWDIEAFYDPTPGTAGKMYARHGGFIAGADLFDPHLFGIAPLEAASMDPQQRLLLETAWHAFENAGMAPDRLGGTSTGVYLGIAGNDYSRLVFEEVAAIDAYAASGTAFSVAAGRLSYVLGLQGPALAVDTACSSSLVALHLAVAALRRGECKLALAGGVNLMLLPHVHVNFCQAGMLAADGRCKTFDAAADGYVRGEGCGLVVLKRLADAQADGDRILAVVRGSAVNQDGRSGGLTAPNGAAQEAVLRAALADASLAPADIDYIEAHGTGTSLGDPIELRALGAVFAAGRSDGAALPLGSIKTNIGHLEAAAGIAGVMKVVLSLQQGEIPAHLHVSSPTTHVDWGALRLRVATEATPLPARAVPRRAGVSSFGFSGTNAHVILEEAPPVVARAAERLANDDLQLLLVSGKSTGALRRNAGRLAAELARTENTIAEAARETAVGRAHLTHRVAVLAGDHVAAAEALESAATGGSHPALFSGSAAGRTPEVAFLFTGQGCQYPGMGRRLFEQSRVFRDAIERCDNQLRDVIGRSLVDLLFSGTGNSELEQTRFTQPALFAVQYALAQLWGSWGVEPGTVLGHSAGELVAACVAGVFSLEDGLRFSAERGRLMHELPKAGCMAAIFADETAVIAALAPYRGRLWIAAVNAADNVVISGDERAVEEALELFAARGVRGKRLEIANAFHSPLVEPMLDALELAAAAVTYRPARAELIGNLNGRVLENGQVSPAYWRRHVREAVRFKESVDTLQQGGASVLIEIGPHPVLLGMLQDGVGAALLCLPSLRRDEDDWRVLLGSLAQAHVRGVGVDWATFHAAGPRARVALPGYAFDRERFWVAATTDHAPSVPPAEAARAAAAEQAVQGPLDLRIATYPEKFAVLDRLSAAYQVDALCELGAFKAAGERASAEDLRARLGLAPTYRHLVARWLEGLAADGTLDRDGDVFVANAPLAPAGAAALAARYRAEFADYPEVLRYVERCGAQLAAVLRGQASALETLFPGGSFDEAAGLYQHSAVARYLNGIVRAAVAAVGRAVRGRLEVLEIGAGTGGTTAALLDALPAGRCRYAFTDTSQLFLERAARKFAGHDFVRYALLDIERDTQEQGFGPASFDLIVAANVLHATRDLRATIERVRMLLAPGGVLVLSETTRHPRYFDITTGLIEGWQAFDDDLRRDNPLIDAPAWVRLLEQSGFTLAAAEPVPQLATAVLGNHVIVAGVAASGVRGGAGVAARAATPAAEEATSAMPPTWLAELEAATPAEHEHLLGEFVRERVMATLRLGAAQTPDKEARLIDLGLDSLMAVQLRNELATRLRPPRKLPATLVFDHPSIAAIARFLAGEMFAAAPDAAANEQPEDMQHPERALESIATLTEDAAEQRLLRHLAELQEKQ